MAEFDETAFQEWYKGWAAKTGIDPNPDNPAHLYNYREAYKAGAYPTWQPEHQQYRWPDRWKAGGGIYEQTYPHDYELVE